MIIRSAKMSDLEELTLLEELCFPPEEAATRESIRQRLQTLTESFFVAEIEHKIIGLINGSVTNSTVIFDEMFKDANYHISDGNYQAIFGLDVHPGYRRKGIAAKLMVHMIAVAKAAGRKGVILTCKDKLVKYYESFGFINKGISESTHGNAVWYDMVLEF
ncbi:GNAT family N-acetyltransferase [Desulfosporosinus sp. OT]|uniref:GNAT family N-acetyltransferase n=1 Tax=Desulfosporosinus sp. OT TaxID=913865 RepID=UPI000A2F1054|nr:GNAT family N-acetyltransferase [Desulfosporosinus sp. OT]